MNHPDEYFGIEIGGSKLQIVRGDASAQILERRRLTVQRDQGGVGIRRQMETALLEMLRAGPPPRGIGVGFGGPVDWETGAIACSHQIEGWSGFPLAEWLRQLTGVPVHVDNDANVGALGEARKGAGKGHDPVFYLTLGSGVGGGLVAHGRIYHGAKPGEAEIGQIRLDRSGATVESRCAGWAVDGKIREAIAREPAGVLALLCQNVNGGEAKHLGTALAQNDPTARRILDETAADLGFALSHVAHLFHPAMIVLGGGLGLLGQPLSEAVTQACAPFLMKIFRPGPRICPAELGEDAIPVGALELARVDETPCALECGDSLSPSGRGR
jgi:glucokinase